MKRLKTGIKAVFDYHGFQRTEQIKKLPKRGETVSIPLRSSLRLHGVGGDDLLEGNEEGMTFWSLSFVRALRDGELPRFECAGCERCSPSAVLRRVEQLAERLLRAALPSIIARVTDDVRQHLLDARVVAVLPDHVQVQFGTRRRAFPWIIQRQRSKAKAGPKKRRRRKTGS